MPDMRDLNYLQKRVTDALNEQEQFDRSVGDEPRRAPDAMRTITWLPYTVIAIAGVALLIWLLLNTIF